MKTINDIKKSACRIRARAGSLLVYTLFTAIASSMATSGSAQTFAEWFKQKRTQKKYLLQQIAALQVYAGYLKKGYRIAGHGLGSISGYLLSESSLHRTYYQKLNSAGPPAKENPQIGEIFSWQVDIIDQLNGIEEITGISTNERNYLLQVRDAVLRDCEGQMTQLENVITDGMLEMSDSERLRRIATIHGAMQENLRFVSAFSEQVKIYGLQRRQEKNNVAIRKELFAIH